MIFAGQRDGWGRPDRLTANRNAAAMSGRHTGTLPLVLNPTNEDPNLESRRPPYRHPDASGAQGPRRDHSSKELFPPPCPPIEHLRALAARGPSPRRWAGSRSSFSSSWRAWARSARSPRSASTPRWPRGCPIRALYQDIPIAEESIVYDRTGHRRAGTFGTSRREVVTFDQIPKVLIDATTAVEDKTFWENAGFDPVAIASAGLSSIRGDSRGASTITQQLVRARLLDPAARQGPAPNRRAQAQGDHPVDPPDQGVPRRAGQADDHHRLPQPELLRQPELRREGGGRDLLRDRPLEDRPRPRRRSSRACPSRRRTTTSSATPIEQCTRPSPRTATARPKSRARRPDRHHRRPAAEPHPRPARRRRPHAEVRRPVHRRPTSRPRRTTRSSSGARRRRAGSRRTSCGPSATS